MKKELKCVGCDKKITNRVNYIWGGGPYCDKCYEAEAE